MEPRTSAVVDFLETRNGEGKAHLSTQIISMTDDEPSLRGHPAKRTKRGKYVFRACAHCQRMKIKCDGGYPCRPCITKRRDCIVHQTLEKDSNNSNTDLLYRLTQIEQQLSSITSSKMQHVGEPHVTRDRKPSNNESEPVLHVRRFSRTQTPPKAPVPTFSGETSMVHVLNQMENRLEQLGVMYQEYSSPPASQPLTPSPNTASENNKKQQSKKGYVEYILLRHGLTADRDRWEEYLRKFCDEVHVLYPFLHLSTLQTNHNRLSILFLGPAEGNFHGINHRLQVAQLFLCLALGRCTAASRVDKEDGHHSAGWSLYSVAVEISGDLLEIFRVDADPLLLLQTLALIVVYLFHLDANERAEKVLALIVSHSHHLGLHRQRTLEKMPVFEEEIFRRLWWSLYVLDRRFALETGRPFLIQDVNVDAALPRKLSEEWLSRHKETHLTSKDLATDIQREILLDSATPVTHLLGMVSYSRVVGKVWEATYGAGMMGLTSSSLINEYLESLVAKSERDLPAEVTYRPQEPFSAQFEGKCWWQIKLTMLLQMRWTYVRLLIRKPMLQQCLTSGADQDNVENESICIQLARKMMDDFAKIPEAYPKHVFPFIHLLTSTTMLALGLIIKDPSLAQRHGKATLQTARSLQTYCRRTWVSGKLVRTIMKLNQMVDSIIEDQGTSSQQEITRLNQLELNQSLGTTLDAESCYARKRQQASPTLSVGEHFPYYRATPSSLSSGHSVPAARRRLPPPLEQSQPQHQTNAWRGQQLPQNRPEHRLDHNASSTGRPTTANPNRQEHSDLSAPTKVQSSQNPADGCSAGFYMPAISSSSNDADLIMTDFDFEELMNGTVKSFLHQNTNTTSQFPLVSTPNSSSHMQHGNDQGIVSKGLANLVSTADEPRTTKMSSGAVEACRKRDREIQTHFLRAGGRDEYVECSGLGPTMGVADEFGMEVDWLQPHPELD